MAGPLAPHVRGGRVGLSPPWRPHAPGGHHRGPRRDPEDSHPPRPPDRGAGAAAAPVRSVRLELSPGRLQWQDIDLTRGTAAIRRSRHLWTYGEPKTAKARRVVQLFPETVRLLRALGPLRMEPRAAGLHPHGWRADRAQFAPAALVRGAARQRRRVRGLYSTKDTFVSRPRLEAGVTIAWLETQTGVNYLTFRRHYGRWMPSDAGRELDRFATLDPGFASTSPAFVTGNKADREQRQEKLAMSGPSECEMGDLNPHGVATTGS